MNIYFSYFLIALFSFFWPISSQQEVRSHVPDTLSESIGSTASLNDYCRMENDTFRDGEELTYKIYYNVNFIWISAGTVTFNINKLGDKYHAQAVGKTYGGYDWIFKVRDTFHSVLDANTLLPIESTRIVNEGKHTRYDYVNYLRNSRLAESVMGKTRQSAESKIITIDQCVHDILSTMYAMRNTPIKALEQQKKFKIDMMLDQKKYPITLHYKGMNEKKRIKGLGDLDAYLFEPTLIAGNVFSDDSRMQIWISKDRNKVPLLIESPISVGKIKAILIDHKKLRYEANGY